MRRLDIADSASWDVAERPIDRRGEPSGLEGKSIDERGVLEGEFSDCVAVEIAATKLENISAQPPALSKSKDIYKYKGASLPLGTLQFGPSNWFLILKMFALSRLAARTFAVRANVVAPAGATSTRVSIQRAVARPAFSFRTVVSV